MERESENNGSGLSLRERLTLFQSARWRKWGALGTVALAVVMPVQSIRTETAGAELEQKLAQLREQGEPIALSELAPESIADEANAATYYMQARMKLKPVEQPSSSSQWAGSLLTRFLRPEASREDRAKLEPQVRDLIQRNQEVFSLVREATERSRCAFPLDLRSPMASPVDSQSPRSTAADSADCIFRLQNFSALLAARAMIKAEDGDLDAAVDDVLTGLKVARAADADPTGIYYIDTLNRRRAAIGWGVWGLTQSRPLTFEQAKALFDELGRSSITSAYKQSVRGHRALVNYYFTVLRSGRKRIAEQVHDLHTRNDRDWVLEQMQKIAGSVSTAQIYEDQTSYLDLYTSELKLIDEPYAETIKALKAMNTPRNYADYEFYGITGGPYFDLVSTFSASAEINLSQTAMALKAYKSRFGDYPSSVEEAESKLGWKLPLDPYTRRPLRYRREGKGFTVYSCGPNMKDDGGLINWWASSTGKDVGDMGFTWDE